MDFYQRKLYALLHNSTNNNLCQLPLDELQEWWEQGCVSAEIGSSSDRVNLKESKANNSTKVEVRHPISGEKRNVDILGNLTELEIDDIRSAIAPISTGNAKKLFWWFWRFYPELFGSRNANNINKDGLLFPAHRILPDCPWHSYSSTVSEKKAFESKTRRPFQVPKTDSAIAIHLATQNRSYNGTMFSSKWLADDMGLQKNELETLKGFVEEAHQECKFGEGSPADWWAIVLADGDGMGDYVSGENLKYYKDYIVLPEIEPEISNQDEFNDLLNKTKKRMGPATHVGLNRALLDFSNRLVPYLTEQRFCGKVIYSGGDDVMAILPLEDLPEYLLSLRAAWSGKADPGADKDPNIKFVEQGGYWQPEWKIPDGDRTQLPDRPLFTMGANATISMGIVIAYKTVPLPTVLESLWEAEKDRAKKLLGKNPEVENPTKDGLCFRVIYGGGNQLEALMKGHLLSLWWDLVKNYNQDLSPLLYRLAEELPRRAVVTDDYYLFSKAAKVILSRRDESKKLNSTLEKLLIKWLNAWEDWVNTIPKDEKKAIGTKPEDLGKRVKSIMGSG